MKELPSLRRPDGKPVVSVSDRTDCQKAWRKKFADHLYGPIPAPPDRVDFQRRPIAGDPGERLVIDLSTAGSRFDVDAALWLPKDRTDNVPIIIGLGFLGPVGAIAGSGFPIDQKAIIETSIANTRPGGRISEVNRGQHLDRWPIASLLSAGYGVLLSCYGSWVADDRHTHRTVGLGRILGSGVDTGAISLWAWTYQRLVDIALRLPDVEVGPIVLAGHSRLGKAALWAGATDDRVGAVLVNNSGCAGASLSGHQGGETLAKLRARFPHWTVLDGKTAADPTRLLVDQHQLIACMAPRIVYVASASNDQWADPAGEYLALRAAAPFWGMDGDLPDMPPIDQIWRPGSRVWSGKLAWHLRPGDHDLTRWDWRRFLTFLERRKRQASADRR